MPIYSYQCPCCGAYREVQQGMNDVHALACDDCDMDMDRVWTLPTISGDLPTTGTDYEHYDAVSGLYITSKSQWKDALKRTGRVEYQPDSGFEAAQAESKYIDKHAAPGDTEANREKHVRIKKALRAPAEAALNNRLEKAAKEVARELPNPD